MSGHEKRMEFLSDDDPNVKFSMMQDQQGDIWLAIVTPNPEIFSSFRLCTRQGGGHRNNKNLRNVFAALLSDGPLAELSKPRPSFGMSMGDVDFQPIYNSDEFEVIIKTSYRGGPRRIAVCKDAHDALAVSTALTHAIKEGIIT